METKNTEQHNDGQKQVFELPMRDGNPAGTVTRYNGIPVFELPMRDGN